MMPSWLRNLAKLVNSGGLRSRRRRQNRGRRPSFRPVFETFEERLVPTALSIPTTLVTGRGNIVQVPIVVDTLFDDSQAEGQMGLSGGGFVVWYNPNVFSINPAVDINLGTISNPSASDPSGLQPGDGYSPSNPNGWEIAQPVTNQYPGQLIIGLQNTGTSFITGTAGGVLAVLNFHTLATAPLGPSNIDLAADSFGPGSSPITYISDTFDNANNSLLQYSLNPAPQDNFGSLQTVTFGGTVTGGTFALVFNGATTSPITYSSNATTLQTNIQNALNDFPNVGPVGSTGTTGNSLVVANSGTKVTITLQGQLGGSLQSAMTASSSLTGTNPTISVTDQGSTSAGQPPLFNAFAYYGLDSNDPTYFDPQDGTVDVTGTDQPPIATNDLYAITERALPADPGLSVAAAGVLANDVDPQGNPLAANMVASPTHGSLTLNSDGSFVYTPVTGYLGPDSFTYYASDAQTGLSSNVATVSLTVTSRISIPTNLTATQGQTITVPVNIDNPNPTSSGGLTGASLAIAYDPTVLQVVETAPNTAKVFTGTVTSAENEVQTLTFGGTINGGTFTLALNTSTTSAIAYSSTPATLQANIQSALNTTLGTGNTVVTALSATSVTITFQGTFTDTFQNALTVVNNLTGSSPTLAAAITASGQSNWTLNGFDNNTTQPGQLGIAVSNANPQFSTVAGSLVQIVFNVLATAPGGPTNIYIVNSVTPLTVQVTTSLAFDGHLTLPPRPPLQSYPTFVQGVDGIVTVAGTSQFLVTGPTSVAAGTPFTYTVTAEDAGKNVATNYTGTVTFSSSDSQAVLPPNSTLVSGVGVFTATLKTSGSQILSATDTTFSSITGNSTIQVSALAATHLAFTAPTSAAQGTGFTFTVTAEDQFNNPSPTYTGTVHFSSSDAGAGVVLPGNSTLLSGVGIFTATLQTMGTQTLTATDTATASITGTTTLSVIGTGATHFIFSVPTGATAGTPFTFTVTAETGANSQATTYTGTVSFSSSDGLAVLPANATLTSGQGTFTATLKTASNQTLTATDTTAVPAIAGASSPIAVSATAATHFAVNAPVTATAGSAFAFTVTAEDPFNNFAPSYNGTVNFASTDTTAVFAPTLGTVTGGVGTFSVTLKTAGSQELAATDTLVTSISGISNHIAVSGATATHLAITTPATVTAGAAFSYTVTAEDQFNNTSGGYTGTVAFSSTDSTAVFVPTSGTLTGGIGTFSVTLDTAGPQTLTGTDTGTSSITGTSNNFTVSAAAATHFAVSAPTPEVAGAGFKFTVTAEDPFNNTATAYTGTVGFSSSDVGTATSLPANSALVAGVGTFNTTLTTAGNQTLTATDINTTSITGASDAVQVVAASASRFNVTAPATAAAGVGFSFTVQAADKFGNPASGYTGTVAFTSSDSIATLPSNSTLSNGLGVFTATLRTSGSQRITAADSMLSGINGSSNAIVVTGAAATHIGVTAPVNVTAGVGFTFTVAAEDQFNNPAAGYNGTVAFTSSDPGAVLPVPSTLVASVGVFSATLTTAGSQTLTATDTTNSSLVGASNSIAVSASAATHFVLVVPPTATAGTQFTFTVTALDQFNNTAVGYLGTVHFTSSDTTAAFAPAANSPLTAGQGIFNATLTEAGNQTLTATDKNVSSVTGFSSTIAVSAATATHMVVVAPTNAGANVPFNFTVTAFDQFNNLATGYTGTVLFSASDTALGVSLPPGSTLTNGSGIFSATLQSLAHSTLTATDSVVNTVTGHSGPITVSSVTATQFVITGPTTTTAGTPFVFTVTAENGSNTPVTNYNGTVVFTSSDTGAGVALPPNTQLVSGLGTFTATLVTVGSQTITVADKTIPSIQGTSTISVTPSAATHLAVSAPASVTAGSNFIFTVKAEDSFNNPVPSYTGTVQFTTSDSAGSFVTTSGTLTGGVGTFSATLETAGTQTITATDTTTSSLTANSGPIAVNAAAASHFVLTAPASATAGVGFGFTITAEDPFNNVATGYTGIVHFTSSDAGAGVKLPANSTLAAGTGTFSATLQTAGSQTLTATDTVNSSVTGVSSAINVAAGAQVTHFVVDAPTNATAGVPITYTVTADTAANTPASSYTGTVTFSSSDGAASFVPASATLTGGVGTFTVTLKTAGNQTLTATDTVASTLTGASNPIAVSAAAATHFAVIAPATSGPAAGFSFTVEAEDQFNNVASSYGGIVNFTSSDTAVGVSLPANSTLTAGAGTFSATLQTQGTQTLVATDTINTTITGTANVTVGIAQATHFVFNAPTSATAGTPITFTVTAETAANNPATGYTGTVTFTSSDGTAIFVPATTTLTSGTGIFTVTLKTAGSQTLTATDTATSSLQGASGPIAVNAASATHIVLTGPTTAAAGTAVTFTVSAEDQFNNAATGYTGTVAFTSSDSLASFVPTSSTLTAGVGTFTVTLKTVGSQTVSATDTVNSSLTASSPITVTGAAATHFVVSAPTAATAGTAITFTVTAEDQFNNTATAYTGTVAFTSSDSLASFVPASSTLSSGIGTFNVTLKTAGTQTLTAADTLASGLTGTSGPIAVSAATATHLAVSAPGAATAGASFSFTVTAEDQFNNTATGYTGTVAFSSTDGQASFVPASSTLTAGQGTFSATLKTAGTQTLIATDTTSGAIKGSSGPIVVSATAATHLVFTAPTSGTPGTGFPFTVTAEDQFNNPAPTYTGTVHFSTSDAGAGVVIPGNSTLTAGVGIFSATLQSAGSQTLTATDTTTSTISGTATIDIGAAQPTHFLVSAPTSAAAGSPFAFTVTAETAANNIATGYAGTVAFTSSDSAASFAAVNGTLSNGQGVFTVTLKTAGNQTLTATDTSTSTLAGASNPIAVSAATATHIVVTAPSAATAGTPTSFTVTAEDQFNNTATGYTGTVTFSSSDAAAGFVPTSSTLTAGQGNFIVTLKTVGIQTVTATDTANATLAGTSGPITVSAAAATHFAVTAPTTATAGTGFNFTVTAEDQFNNTATGYTGTVGLTSSDSGTFVPPSGTLAAGVGVFNVTLKSAGSQTLTATDTVSSSITGASGPIAVTAATATHFAISAPTTVTAGTAFNFTVTAEDQFNNTAPSYTGTVAFSSSDSLGSFVPTSATLTAGQGTFSATLKTAGVATLTATDSANSSIKGASSPIAVSAAAATHLVVSAPTTAPAEVGFTFTVTAEDAFNNTAAGYTGTVHFSTSDSGAGVTLPGNSLLTGGVGIFSATLQTQGNQVLSATDTVNSTITGSATVNITPAQATHFAVSAPTSATAGTPFTYTVQAETGFNNVATGYTGTVAFSSSDSQAIFVPASSTLVSGVGIFTATLKTAGNQTLTATDTAASSLTGHSGPVAVSAAAATHLAVTAPAGASPGAGFAFTVTAEDAFNNTASSYTGTVHFSSTDTAAGLPANSLLPAGVGTFSATLQTQGNQILSATDTVTSSISGSATINVSNAAATHFVITAPTNVAAGTAFLVTVTAETATNNVATTYTGTVHFTSSDSQAVLQSDTTLSAGVGIFITTLKTAGAQTITATDTAASSLTGASNTINVSATAATHFAVTAPTTTTAGTAFVFTVTAEDQFNNAAPTYTGTAHFTSSDSLAGLPTDATLNNGVGFFAAVLKTAGTQTITATDTASSNITGSSNAIVVSASTATHFAVGAPGSATAGTAFSVTVTAEDQFNNTATGYSGTVHFTSTDGQAVLPGNTTLAGGTGTFIATLKTTGAQTISAADTVTSSIDGSTTVNVSTAVATHFVVSAPGTTTAGTSFVFTVTAEDSFNNTATGYSGTVHFTSSDSLAGLPVDATLTSGVGFFAADLKTAGNQTISATDTTTSSITGASNTLAVSATTATHFAVMAPGTATAGTGFAFTVIAEDAFNNTASSYNGTVQFTSSDSQAVLPGNSLLSGGLGAFSATLKATGNQEISATDTASSSITGDAVVNVGTSAATHFVVSAPGTTTAGTSFVFTVTAEDQFNNPATGYSGTVHFTSSDGLAGLPTDATLTSGVGFFAASLKTAGNQTITATDTAASSVTGHSNTIAVTAATTTHFGVSAPGAETTGNAFNFTVTAEDQFNNTVVNYNGTVHFTSSDSQAILPGNSLLSGGSGTFSATLKTGGTQTLSATDTITPSITGSAAVNVTISTTIHFVVSAPATASAGNAFIFTVTAEDQFNNVAAGYSGTVQFSSSDPQVSPGNGLPNDTALTSGVGFLAAILKTAGNQTIKATDTVTSSVSGISGNILIGATAATHFAVTAPAAAVPNTSFTFTVTAEDAFNNAATTYNGTVHFTSSDNAATLPANSAIAGGTGTFTATLQTLGLQTLTATDTVTSSINGSSNAINVTTNIQAATHFLVTAPSNATAGTPFSFTVTAETALNATATTYTGTVHFTTSDNGSGVALPTDSVLISGVGVFTATLVTAGNQTITATDTVASSITGPSNTIAVNSAAAATHFAVKAPAGAIDGVAFNFTVTAEDQFNNTVAGYTGTVDFTSSDGAAVLPADSTLTGGSSVFSATLNTSGVQTLTATDTVTSSIVGASNGINVSAPATHLVVSAPSSANAGTAFTFTVTAEDAANNTATGYTGIVHFASSDSLGVLPADASLVNGVGTFTATLETAGNQTITATDTVTTSLTGASNTIAVSAQAVTHFVLLAPANATAGTAFSFTVKAEDQFNNAATGYTGTVHFTSSDTGATLPADTTLSGGEGIFTGTLKTLGSQILSATDTVTSSLTASSTISVANAAATHFVITVPSRWTAGKSFTYTVVAEDQFNNTVPNYSGTVHFSTSDGSSSVSLPADSTLSGGTGTFTATLQTAGNQTLSGTDTTNSSVTGNSSMTINASPTLGPLSSTSGTVGVTFTGTIAINNGTSPFSNLNVTGLTGTGLSATLSGSTITITGTPTTAETIPITVAVTDAAGVTTPVLNTSITISAASSTRLRWNF